VKYTTLDKFNIKSYQSRFLFQKAYKISKRNLEAFKASFKNAFFFKNKKRLATLKFSFRFKRVVFCDKNLI